MNYNFDGKLLTIFTPEGFDDFLRDNNMVREEFNLPVVVAETCKDCNSLFKNCTHFNMPVELQAGITNCNSMFMHCRNFNQPIEIPEGLWIAVICL